MRHSTDRILTTHAGSLPRPDALREAWAKPGASDAEIDALLKSAVDDVVKAQQAVAVDIPNDGEFGKPMRAASDLAAWGTYIFGRLSGFGPTPAGAAAPGRNTPGDRKSTRLNSSHVEISYAVFCLKKKKKKYIFFSSQKKKKKIKKYK